MARQRWEYLAVPFKDAGDLTKSSNGVSPARLNELGADGWEAVGTRGPRSRPTPWRTRTAGPALGRAGPSERCS